MSEEEIINRIKSAIEYDKEHRIETIYDEKPLFRDYLQGILDLYNKEKEKNKELKVLIEQNLKYSHNLEKDLFENCSNYVVSKDKIIAKITECEEAMNKVKQFNPSTYAGIDTFIYAMAQKNILKSLLEEE